MKLEVLKCPDCGANIEFEEGTESCECEYCGAKVTLAQIPNNTNKVFPQKTSPVNKLSGTMNKVPSDDEKKSFVKKVFNVLFIINLFFAGICFIMSIVDGDAFGVFMGLFFAVYAAMFKVLSHTPKGSKYILGKSKGIKPVYFVLICIFLSFALIMLSPTSDENASDTGNTITITEQVAVTE